MRNLINIFNFIIILSCIACNGQENKKSSSIEISKNQVKILPDLFDKKYFHGYQLSPDFDYPIYTHTDNKIGDLTINFINKNVGKQKEWFGFDSKNGIEFGDDPDETYFNNLNKIIKTKLEPNLTNYYIIAENIPAKYLDAKTLDYKYPYKKSYYLYDNEKKVWKFIKEKTVNDGSNEKNITKLQELNEMLPNNGNISIISNKLVTDSTISEISLVKTNGNWSSDCNSENQIFISSDINNVQFNIPNRFSMNAQLKKIGTNIYEFYFTDFPPIIPLPDNMKNWDDIDNKKAVGRIELISDSKIKLSWFGFYHKKLKKNIQTENPFKGVLLKCES